MVKVSLMSDPSAIITQVNPNEQVIPAESKNHSQTDNTDFVSGTDGAAGVNGQKKDKDSAGGSAGGGSRHSGGGGCFRSLFCCLKIRSKKPKPEHNNPPVAPLANTTAAEQPATNRGHSLLPCKNPLDRNKKCVVIDLDETLVHSSFKPIDNADFVVPIEIDLTVHQVYVLKRPHVDEFLRRMGELFECVLFTASLAKYADPVADLLDKWEVFRARLFRDSCVYHRGNYVKDLGRLGRELKDVIIIDNSPASYIFHPENAIPVNSWFDDMDDRELLELIPTMEKIASTNDIYPVVKECALSKQRPPLSSVSIMPPAQEIGAYTITSPPPPQPPSYATVSAIRTSNNSDSGDVSSVSSGSYTVVASTSASSATFVGPNTRLSGATNATSNNPQPSESINVNVDNPNSSSVSNIQPQQTTAYQGSEPLRENNTTTTTTTTTIFSTASETGFDETNKGQVSLLAGDNEVKRSASELVTVSNSSQVELNAADNSAGSKGSISASVAATTNSTQA